MGTLGHDESDTARLAAEFEKWKAALEARLAKLGDDWPQPKVQDGIGVCASIVMTYTKEEASKDADNFKRLYNRYLDDIQMIATVEAGFRRKRVLY